jgi:uncharacterized iron-regulated protein
MKSGRWALVALLAVASVSASAQNAIYLLGEVHDNPTAHAQRFELIEKLLAGNFKPVIAMEQFDRDNQAELDLAMHSCKDSDCVILKAGGKGWEWNFYKPVIETALKRRLPIIAVNVSSKDAMKIARDGLGAAISPDTLHDFNLDKPLDGDLFEKQKTAIEIGHCHMLPNAALKGMVNAQVARDVWMAKAIRENASHGLILLAGNGHVRKDIGVYHWLSSAERARTQAIAYTEDEDDPPGRPPAPVFDRTIHIEPFERNDPCEAFTGRTKIQTWRKDSEPDRQSRLAEGEVHRRPFSSGGLLATRTVLAPAPWELFR